MPAAHVVHQLPGRLRLRIPQKRKDPAFFDRLKARLAEIEGIERVSVDDLTGSVLIHHYLSREELDALLETDLELALEAPPTPPARHALTPLGAAIHAVDHGLQRATQGTTDFRALLFVLLVALAIRQFLRGEVMIPAVAFLWNAFDLVLHPPGGTASPLPTDSNGEA